MKPNLLKIKSGFILAAELVLIFATIEIINLAIAETGAIIFSAILLVVSVFVFSAAIIRARAKDKRNYYRF